jgi:hypothetical protein
VKGETVRRYTLGYFGLKISFPFFVSEHKRVLGILYVVAT